MNLPNSTTTAEEDQLITDLQSESTNPDDAAKPPEQFADEMLHAHLDGILNARMSAARNALAILRSLSPALQDSVAVEIAADTAARQLGKGGGIQIPPQ